jgi:hypothetical protein
LCCLYQNLHLIWQHQLWWKVDEVISVGDWKLERTCDILNRMDALELL